MAEIMLREFQVIQKAHGDFSREFQNSKSCEEISFPARISISKSGECLAREFENSKNMASAREISLSREFENSKGVAGDFSC